jgi:hypothetical protein
VPSHTRLRRLIFIAILLTALASLAHEVP